MSIKSYWKALTPELILCEHLVFQVRRGITKPGQGLRSLWQRKIKALVNLSSS